MKNKKLLWIIAAVLAAFLLVFAGCSKAGVRSDDDDDDGKTPFVGPNDDNPGGGAQIPAVEVGGSKKYDLVLWEGYASASNASAVDIIADNGPVYYGDGKFNPSWFQPGIVLDLECKSENGWVYFRLWDIEDVDYGEWYSDTAGDWGNESDGWQIDGFIHNLRVSYSRLMSPQGVNPALLWSAEHPEGFEDLKRIQIINPNLIVVTKVTLRNVPLSSAPAGWNNPGITEIAGIKPELDGGKGTKAEPYTAELEVPPSQINIAVGDIKANYPMFSTVAVYAGANFAEPPMKSATFLPEGVATDIFIKVTAGDKTERYFKISTTRKPGYVENTDGTVTRTIFSGSHTGTFNISKSGGTQFVNNPFGGTIHGTMDMEYIITGGYIEVGYTGSAPQLHLRSDQTKTGGNGDVTLNGSDSSSGVRRYNSSDILTQINNNFGYGTLGTSDPSVMVGLQITGAGIITKITIVYDPNHASLKTFNTVDQMKAAAIKFPGNTAKIKAAMTKAQSGQPITVVFFGGSITQHGKPNNGLSYWKKSTNETIWYSGATQQINSGAFDTRGYAGRVAKWFVDTFPSSNITYVNSSYGGMGSYNGLQWLDTFVGEGAGNAGVGGLLNGTGGSPAGRLFEPDLVFLEFAVNDSMGGWGANGANIDGIITRLEADSTNPGVMVLISFDFDNGLSADVSHTLAAQIHNTPVVSNRAALWPNIRVGLTTPYNRAELAYDSVHPNERGHEVYADFIINRLDQIRKQ